MMAPSISNHYTLEQDGHTFAVETESAGLQTMGRLFVDGVQVDEQKSDENAISLTGADLTVVVSLNWLGNIKQAWAVPRGISQEKADEEGIAFDPPVGSRAARMEQLARERPVLYAARHVVIAIGQVIVGFLGIGALLFGLLPRIALPDIPWPEVELPAIPWPTVDLPEIPWPDVPLPAIDLPHLTFLEPLKEFWASFNWLVPIVIAVLVAINEVEKRRKRQQAAARRKGHGVIG